MSPPNVHRFTDRAVLQLAGPDAHAWLDNLVTNDLTHLDTQGIAFAALLSPQGKILFEFFVHRASDALLLDVNADSAGALLKRLGLYKLRAKVALTDASDTWAVLWGTPDTMPAATSNHRDPRAPAHLCRALALAEHTIDVTADARLYADTRVALGIAEAPADYALGDIFPHEANYDLVNGVSFTKGCFVGQEVVARMQNKSVVRKRIVRIAADTALASGAIVTAGTAEIGTVGTVSRSGLAALAMLRLDRAAEALDTSVPLRAGETVIRVDADAIDRYRTAAANRRVHDL